MNIIRLIKDKILPDTIIPKPFAKSDFIVKGWGTRRNEEALIYLIPNHKNPTRPYEKGINKNEWLEAYNQINNHNELSRSWFNQHMKECAKEGGCNFTTIGDIFQLLDIAYYEYGIYKKS